MKEIQKVIEVLVFDRNKKEEEQVFNGLVCYQKN